MVRPGNASRRPQSDAKASGPLASRNHGHMVRRIPGRIPPGWKFGPGCITSTMPVNALSNVSSPTVRRPLAGSFRWYTPRPNPSKTTKWLNSQNKIAGGVKSRSSLGSLLHAVTCRPYFSAAATISAALLPSRLTSHAVHSSSIGTQRPKWASTEPRHAAPHSAVSCWGKIGVRKRRPACRRNLAVRVVRLPSACGVALLPCRLEELNSYPRGVPAELAAGQLEGCKGRHPLPASPACPAGRL